MDAAASALFPAMDQKFDFSALLKSAASTMAAINASNVAMPSSPTEGSPPGSSNGIYPIPATALPKFVSMRPVYAPSGYGRQILIYESRSYPGHRREFAYKTRFTNQSGLTTVYYRCMACRALRHRLQRMLPKDKLPAVPCIAVKNDLLINDPDYPEASDHFCTPLTIDESNHRLKVTFERGYKRARMKQAAEDKANAAASPSEGATATCEITEQPLSLDQYMWMKNESSPVGSASGSHDDAAHSTSSVDDATEAKAEASGFPTGFAFDQQSTVTNETTTNSDVDMEDDHQQPQTSKSRLDALLRLQDEQREASISPNENVFPKSPSSTCSSGPLGLASLASLPCFSSIMANNPDMTPFIGLQSLLSNFGASLAAANAQQTTMNSTPMKSGPSEIAKALKKPKHSSPGAHVNEIINKYIKSSWDLPENSGNSRSAAELTCTLILSLARHVPNAASSMKQGKWARKDYMGEEVYGKTLAIIGLGRIGQEVASRMQAFGMKVIGFDPIVTAEEAAKRQIELKQLDELWPLADYITVHVPLIPQTKDLLCKATFAKCKHGVRIVNVARGGIINEQDLVEALDSGVVAGAAVDVFTEEPPTYRPLVDHPQVVSTPHLGASTIQAQQRVAVEIAENIISLNNGTGLFGALNAAALAAVLDDTKAQYVRASTNLAQILAGVSKTDVKEAHIQYPSAATGLQKAMEVGASIGLLQAAGQTGLNLVNAEGQAKKAGIKITTDQGSGNEITLAVGNTSVSGYPSPAGTIISAVNSSKVPVPLLATGTLVISTVLNDFADKTSIKPSVEYGLIGGGRLGVFTSLDKDEAAALADAGFAVINFN
uniref:D-3-phosphoglycerate dehydrogenase n=1 Tax=Panagrellus redivivus TaxID=6233 RepID=A0A7E4V929_PANRE